MGVADKIKELDEELHRTQKNKATEYHIGILKAKIAKLKREMASPARLGGGGGGGGGFATKKSGDATVALIGWPSVGKSTILNALTNAESRTASYEFTTLTCIPGTLFYNGSQIQILDLPGILEGAHDGRGRGREVLAVARSADLILIIIDVFKPDPAPVQRELEAMGIRLDKSPPKIFISKKSQGGIEINSTVKLTKLEPRMIMGVLNEYGIHNAIVVIREDMDTDALIDACVGTRKYTPSLIVVNKSDLVTQDYLKRLKFPFLAVSAEKNKNINELKEEIYKKLNMIRVYTKPREGEADMERPLMLPSGSTVGDACRRILRDQAASLSHARIWGKSAKFPGQKNGREHILLDGDIITLFFKKSQEEE